MKTLVTGSHGFIGKHLVKALDKRGDEILKVPHSVVFHRSGLDTMVRDFSPNEIYALHAYGNMAHQKDDVYQILEGNYLVAYHLLSATKELPYKAFINVSSSSVLLPHQTMYSATKLGAEALCKAFVDEYNKPIVTVRPFTVYGPGEASFRFIPTVFRSCITGEPMDLAPDPVHDYIYVQDFVQYALAAAVNIEKAKGMSIEFGTGVKTTNNAIVKMVEEITGKKANIRSTRTMRSFDNASWVAKDSPVMLSFTPIYEGLQKYYESIKK